MKKNFVTSSQFFNHWARTGKDPDGNYIHTYIISKGDEDSYINWMVKKMWEELEWKQSRVVSSIDNQKEEEKAQTPEEIKNDTHNLDLNKASDRQIFYDKTFQFLDLGESFRTYAYDDRRRKNEITEDSVIVGKITVGYGFNMSKPEARTEWLYVFPNNVPNFDDVLKGKTPMSESDARKMANYNIKSVENTLKHFLYDKNTKTNIYDQLNPNEKIAIISASYNGWAGGPKSIIGPKQKHFLTDYVLNQNSDSLLLAVKDLHNSSIVDSQNKGKGGLNNRRAKESELMNSTTCDLFTLPGNKMPEKILQGATLTFKIGDRISGKLRTNQHYVNGKYFVWHHNSNSQNPNQEHVKSDGKIFSIYNEQFDWLNSKRFKGCQCQMEQLPDLVYVDE
jgi:hypothetical protein